MHEPKLSMSAKGKGREDTHWQLGWWDLYPLTEKPTRPIAWSKSSVIFIPHPTQPAVLARHFPSSRQFILPSPGPWASLPVPYEPPSIISVSPSDDWLFAYFPGHDGEGAGCLWRRNGQLDTWALQEWWTLAKGSGVVAAEWNYPDREWILSDAGQPYRLPPRGPVLHTNVPNLILVTQAHQIHVCLLPSILMPFKIYKASLLHPSTDSQPVQDDVPVSSHGGKRVCMNAAIGINYNDSTIVVATRSHLLPPHSSDHIPFNTMDLGLHLDITESGDQSDSLMANEWEQWGEESTVELSVLVVRCDGRSAGIRVLPVAPLRHSASHLTNLRFCVIPPDIVPPSPTITRDPRRPPKECIAEKGTIYLVATFLDFDDYTSLPKSEISSFPLIRGKTGEIFMHPKGGRTRTFDTGTVAFLATSPSPKRVLVGFLDPNGTVTRRHTKLKETRIGSMATLNPIDLTIDDQWETTHIISPTDGTPRDIPVGIAVSPNHALICSISPSTTISARTTVHAVPRLQRSTSGPPRGDFSRSLVSSILSRNSPSDVIHALTMSVTPLDGVFATLYNSLSIFEAHSAGLLDLWVEEILGVATEIYLGRAQRAETDAEKELLNEWGRNAHDMTSIAALNAAFEDCRDDESYDLEAVWQLVGLSLWFIGILERLMKQCVYVGNEILASGEDQMHIDSGPLISDAQSSSGVSVLLNLLHPYATGNLQTALHHVKRFCDDIRTLTPKSENAQMAKDVMMDGVDSSGVRLDVLGPLLQEFHKDAQKIPTELLKKALVNCSPAPSLQPYIRSVVEKILASEVIDRLRLFIKPHDLIDGVSRLTVGERAKEDDPDVVSKGVLLHTGATVQCVRCGGRSEIGGEGSVAGHISLKWSAWERIWSSRCVCGGAWIRSTLQ